jgi:hypothetical protein
MKRLTTTLTIMSLVGLPALGLAAPAQAASNLNCNGTYNGGTFRNVVIRDGATCVIKNARVTGNVTTVGAPRLVRIIDTELGGNVHIRNVTRSVIIGAAGCRVDPPVANNVVVEKSHNVAVCQLSVDNNLILRNNTGRINARFNIVCGNIRVVDNHLFALRVRRNVYAGDLTVARNTVQQQRRVSGNAEYDGTAGQCRKSL